MPDLALRKRDGVPIVMLTCYDALFARLLEGAGVDILLVGDSVNEVLAGRRSTLSATLDQMIYHAASVRRGTQRTPIVVDMPFLTYQVSIEDAIRNAGRVMAEAGQHIHGDGALGPHATGHVNRHVIQHAAIDQPVIAQFHRLKHAGDGNAGPHGVDDHPALQDDLAPVADVGGDHRQRQAQIGEGQVFAQQIGHEVVDAPAAHTETGCLLYTSPSPRD